MNDALLTLSFCAQNILDELKRHKDRILKSREDDLIKSSKI